MAEVYRPPEIVDIEGPVLFLAGPIQGAPNWQDEAIDIIRDIDSQINIASPRKDYPKGTFVYERQVDWETAHLNRAARYGAILFWLAAQSEATPGRAYAQTSRFELGEWKARHQSQGTKLTVGIEKGFGNARYITRRLNQDCPNVQVQTNLADTCFRAVELIHSA